MSIEIQFLKLPPEDSFLQVGVYNSWWVVISILLAILSCYAALRAAARVRELSNGISRLSWILISGLTMGVGVWAMHFIGMLALSLPCRVAYDPTTTLISIIPSILSGGLAMGIGWNGIRMLRSLGCSVLIGAGIATMHYTGMAAMRLEGFVRYDPALFGLSIVAAIALAFAALRVQASQIRLVGHQRDALIALILGLAVSSTHYIGMSSAYFIHGDAATLPSTVFSTNTLSVVIAITTAFLALGALTLAGVSRNREITDQLRESQKNIGQLLAEKETILDNAPAAIAFVKHRHIVSCNRRFEEIFQYETEALIGMSTSNLYESTETYEFIGADAYPISARSDGYTGEVKLQRKDGSSFWGTISGKAVDPHNAHEGSIWIYTDISERKRIEFALQSSNAQLQLLETCVSRLNDIVLITEAEPFDQPGPRIVFVNDAFVRRTGFSREEVIGQTPRIFQGAKTQRSELDRIRAALKRWEPVRAELINYTKAGEEFWLELDIVPVVDSKGWYTHWIAVERDITQRKLAEVTLRESERRHKSMFERNPLPMWVYDCETLALLEVNSATIEQYGYSWEEIRQMTMPDICPSHGIVVPEMSLAIDLQNPATTAQFWTHIRKDGSQIQVEVSAHAIEFQGRSAKLVLAHDITEQMESRARLQHLAFHDVLTGLPNRLQFLNFANKLLQDIGPTNPFSAAILLDLDHFKKINDHWGHRSGDELLKQVVVRIQQCLPQNSFFARLGGDEFVVIVTGIGSDQISATSIVQRLCSEILVALAQGYMIDKREHFTSASLGIALFGDAELTTDELLSRADSAMYSAKADGRNTFRFFDEQLQTQSAAQTELEGELRRTIQNDELHLVYQPQVDQQGNIVGAEALLRWTHPQRGSVSPAQFIPAAESSGFILQIGLWVLQTACKQLAQWQSMSATAGLTMAVNVSAKQFHHPDFVSQVLSELEMSGANPSLLKLELTESLLAQDLDGIIQKMNALKTKGIALSLDDFGTGFSSLSYLKRLPLDQLKIDQGFVRDVLLDKSDAAIVRTVIALGDQLGLNVIAEGVETDEQREFLASNGCYSYQGYFFSRPLKKEDFVVFCSESNSSKPVAERQSVPSVVLTAIL